MKNQKKIGDIVIPSLKSYLENRGFIHSKLISSWARIANEASDWSIPIKITFPNKTSDNGTLHVRVIPSRAPELSMVSKQIIDRINANFGYKAIEKIHLHHGKHIKKTFKEKTDNKKRLGDELQEIKKIKSYLPKIKNLNLLNALTKLGIGLRKE